MIFERESERERERERERVKAEEREERSSISTAVTEGWMDNGDTDNGVAGP